MGGIQPVLATNTVCAFIFSLEWVQPIHSTNPAKPAGIRCRRGSAAHLHVLGWESCCRNGQRSANAMELDGRSGHDGLWSAVPAADGQCWLWVWHTYDGICWNAVWCASVYAKSKCLGCWSWNAGSPFWQHADGNDAARDTVTPSSHALAMLF